MDYYIGMLGIFGFQWAPENFAYCNGAQMTIQQYQMLYALIGSTFGGNDVTYFQVPNLCGRKIISQGQSTASGHYYTIGSFGGLELAQLGQAQLPTHTHVAHFVPGGAGSASNVQVSTTAGQKNTPDAGDYLAGGTPSSGPSAVKTYIAAANKGTTVSLGGVSGGGGSSGGVTVDNAGLGQAFGIMNPYLTMNVCICHTGLWPQRP